MSRVISLARKAIGPRGLLALLLAVPFGACDNGSHLVAVETPPDSTPPTDSTPPVPPHDTVVPPPPDTVVPPPPDTTGPTGPLDHSGIPAGAYHLPSRLYGPRFTGALRAMGALQPESLLVELAAARRASARVLISLVGSEKQVMGPDGHFSLDVWKNRVDRFRGIDFSSYIDDGTIVGHYIMDEPSDPSNWGGTVVSRSDIDEMAKYSKEIWPSMATIIRAWPKYLKGYQFQYLDAAWAQYHSRFGDIEPFISKNVQDAKDVGVALVIGLNVLAGGGTDGLPGYWKKDINSMSASQIKTWGGRYLAEPYACAFITWQFDSAYFARPDIQAAFDELSQKARQHPKTPCRRS